jgi:hypothetical protein
MSLIICTYLQMPLSRSKQGELGGRGMWHAWEKSVQGFGGRNFVEDQGED